MRTHVVCLALVISAIPPVCAQQSLPADVDPQSLSRLPYVKKADLDAEGQGIFEALNGKDAVNARTAPGAAAIYSPLLAEPFERLNQAARKASIGPRYFELSALIGARAIDQQYEWSGHELGARRAGAEQAVIDAIKFNRPLDGIPEKDATLIRFGRALLQDHKVDPALYKKMVEQFGKQGLIEYAIVIGDYVMAGIILTAVDQRLPPDRKPLLPVK